jgi:hypothetical protein
MGSERRCNRARCRPPLSEKEVERIVKSANGWRKPPLWMVNPLGFAGDPRLDMKGALGHRPPGARLAELDRNNVGGNYT